MFPVYCNYAFQNGYSVLGFFLVKFAFIIYGRSLQFHGVKNCVNVNQTAKYLSLVGILEKTLFRSS